jgi:hypothetical protein
MTSEPCPLCGAEAAITVGPVYGGVTRKLWRRRPFEEALYRCAEGHVYESVDEWLERKTGTERLERPPGL